MNEKLLKDIFKLKLRVLDSAVDMLPGSMKTSAKNIKKTVTEAIIESNEEAKSEQVDKQLKSVNIE